MKKIAIMGLFNYSNAGDQILLKCVNYLLGQYEGDYEGIYMNFQPKREGTRYQIYKKLRGFVEKRHWRNLEHKLIYLIMKWFVYKYYKTMFKKVDAVIIASGSYKYGTQNLWTTYGIAIEYAKKIGIPVMLNGMNVQNYDEKDWRCRFLAKRTNYPNVKMITSRDGQAGVDKLLKNYITNKNLIVKPVGDSGFWIKETFPMTFEKKDFIGINLIREGIFSDYGYNISDERLYEFYGEIITVLDKRGYEWRLFTNGMASDYKFGTKLLKKYNLDIKDHPITSLPEDYKLVKFIGECKAIIGARLHACICAYALDIPFAGYIWDEKFIHFAEESKIESRFCKDEEITGENIVDKMEEAMVNPIDEERRNELKNRTKDCIEEFLVKFC